MSENQPDPIEHLLQAQSQRPQDAEIERRVWSEISARGPRAGRRWPARWVVATVAAAIPLAGLALGLALLLGPKPMSSVNRTPATRATPTPQPAPEASARPSPLPPVPAGTFLSSMRMTGLTTGWGVQYPTSLSRSTTGTLLRTVDGGRRWAVVLAAVLLVDPHTAQEAWALTDPGVPAGTSWNGVIRHTTDGGRTWKTMGSVAAGGEVDEMQFVDSRHGWIFATPSVGGGQPSADTTLLRTVDGGGTWQTIVDAEHPPPGARPGLPCPMSGSISTPVFADAMNGWLGAFCNNVYFYATHNGGLTWSPQALPAFPGPGWASGGDASSLSYNVLSVTSPGPRAARVIVSRGYTTGASSLQESALYSTSDDGATWRANRLPAAALSVSFGDPVHAWLITAGPGGDTELPSLYRTLNAGESWTRVLGPGSPLPGSPYVPFANAHVQFVDASSGFILAGPATDPAQRLIYHTADGGRSWTPTAIDLP